MITGRLERGTLRRGDDVEIKGYDKLIKSTVSSALACAPTVQYYSYSSAVSQSGCGMHDSV